ncbi:MAG: esterase-like activity of phytase family protein [Candidatus Contendobacter sp.]|nr:esterase-like activity of phytase family protein [Candidatus Contendobacter sp.]MDG4557868.1 esterase-like activity of phytase family protein [Candidatus Contendobacter sp.]
MPRLILLLALVLGLPASGCAAREFEATPIGLADQVGPGDIYAGIRLLGALRLNDASIDGLRPCGLSGLAWDENAGLLYALSDKGALFHLRPEFDSQGFLSGIYPVAAYPLRAASDAPVRPPFDDAEGLALRRVPDGVELLVSFEMKPRVVRYGPKGEWRGEEPLPTPLRDIRNYRDPNQALESVTIHPRWGVLVGTETPLRADPADRVRIFSGDGRFWTYPLGKAPGNALVDMVMLPDGGLLTLERAFVNPLRPLIISLRRTEPLPAPGARRTPPQVADVAVFDSGRGWLLDNFEGLAHHRDWRFFMVSDDNCNAWQATLLVYFELDPPPRAAMPEAVDKD